MSSVSPEQHWQDLPELQGLDEIDAVVHMLNESGLRKVARHYWGLIDIATSPTPIAEREMAINWRARGADVGRAVLRGTELEKRGMMRLYEDHIRQAEQCIFRDILVSLGLPPVDK